MKIKISMPGKTVIETLLLKGTSFALVKGNELYCNPGGYEGEVTIIELKVSRPAPEAFWSLHASDYMPENRFAVFQGKWTFNPLFP